jgi:hypothetical protein
VEHHDGVGSDAGPGQQPHRRLGPDEPVVGILQVTVDVPQYGALDVPLVVGAPAHVDLDHPHRGVMQVRIQPVGVDENAHAGRRLVLG